MSPLVTWSLGYVYALSGRVAEGLPLLEHAQKTLESRGGASQSLAVVHLGEACSLAGRSGEALAIAERALTLTRERGERGWVAWTLRLLGEIHSHRDPPDAEQAEAHFRQAIALAEELGMRPLVARCHLGLGQLYRRRVNQQHAQEHLTTATSKFRHMGMGFWLEKAEAELKALGDPTPSVSGPLSM